MNAAHLHLALIHFPIASAFLALPLLLLALARRAEVGATLAATGILAIGAIAAGLAVNTGESAEEIVEGLAGVNEAAIHEHEEAAELAMVLSIATGVVGVGAAGLALVGRGKLAMGALGLALAADVATAGAMALAGNAAGAIRHPEIVGETGAAPGTGVWGTQPESFGAYREGGERGDRDGDDD